jgi:hypothetical protein
MCNCIGGEHQYDALNSHCYRTDFSNDAIWKELIALTNAGEFSCEPFLCIIEDRNNENKTAEVLKEFATQTYIIADAQSMKDYTFLLAYVDTVWDEETNEAIGEDLKETRYPAKDVWAPITNLPIANMGFEDFLEEDEEQR